MIEKADRLKKLPPYLFAEIDKAKRLARAAGQDIIDLGVGDPDQPTPEHVIAKLHQAALDPSNHHYALDFGMSSLRTAIAKWYQQRFNIALDPDKEILPLIGSKEGLAHLPLGLVNPDQVVLIPEPCYPPYRSAALFAGAQPVNLPLLADNDFLPKIESIDSSILSRAKLLFLNYPNNPTAACATPKFFSQVVAFARQHQIAIAQDAAYSEITFDGYSAPSILQVEGARELAVEFYSLSKTYNMTGWRIGWACGNGEIIAHLGQVKSNIDSGIFQAVQLAGIAALNSPSEQIRSLLELYQERRDLLCQGLSEIGWQVKKPKATFYIWTKLPKGQTDSIKFAQLLLDQVGVVATPGVGFGPSGEGYIRMALTVAKPRLQEAVARIKKVI
ncbi:LL-diaminopimelate aminotransferase [Candidatus Omnitrophota bacterium]